MGTPSGSWSDLRNDLRPSPFLEHERTIVGIDGISVHALVPLHRVGGLADGIDKLHGSVGHGSECVLEEVCCVKVQTGILVGVLGRTHLIACVCAHMSADTARLARMEISKVARGSYQQVRASSRQQHGWCCPSRRS